ncbi:MAG: hypothetical protein FJ404_02500 [Verrucomicrobia bacterium]|nr:hypothetical protein [Verrucomicrobiota bacterium]
MGEEPQEVETVRAERLLAAELKQRGWTAARRKARRKGDPEKMKIARRRRGETTITTVWIARGLNMGAAGYSAQCLRKLDEGRTMRKA